MRIKKIVKPIKIELELFEAKQFEEILKATQLALVGKSEDLGIFNGLADIRSLLRKEIKRVEQTNQKI